VVKNMAGCLIIVGLAWLAVGIICFIISGPFLGLPWIIVTVTAGFILFKAGSDTPTAEPKPSASGGAKPENAPIDKVPQAKPPASPRKEATLAEKQLKELRSVRGKLGHSEAERKRLQAENAKLRESQTLALRKNRELEEAKLKLNIQEAEIAALRIAAEESRRKTTGVWDLYDPRPVDHEESDPE
jgi:hypothetical protein